MLHCGFVSITNWHREKGTGCEQIDLLNDSHNKPTNILHNLENMDVFSPRTYGTSDLLTACTCFAHLRECVCGGGGGRGRGGGRSCDFGGDADNNSLI